MKSYYFNCPNDKETKQRVMEELKKMGFKTPEDLAYGCFYLATDGVVVGFPNNEIGAGFIKFIKRHQEATELPLFKAGDYIKLKKSDETFFIVSYSEASLLYICKHCLSGSPVVIPKSNQGDYMKVDSAPKFTIGQHISDKNERVFEIVRIDKERQGYVCILLSKLEEKWFIPFVFQSDYRVAPRFCVGQKVRHKGCANSYYVEITEVLACSYNVVDSDGVPNSFLIEKQDEWELVPKPLFKVGEPVVFNGGLYMVQKISKRVSRKEKRGEWVLTIADGVLVGENNVRKATKEEIDKFTGGQNYG